MRAAATYVFLAVAAVCGIGLNIADFHGRDLWFAGCAIGFVVFIVAALMTQPMNEDEPV